MNTPIFICFDETPEMHHSILQARCEGCGCFMSWASIMYVCRNKRCPA